MRSAGRDAVIATSVLAVACRPAQPRAIATDASGCASFDTLVWGAQQLRVMVIGYRPARDSEMLRGGYTDTLGLRLGSPGRECYFGPGTVSRWSAPSGRG